MTGERPSKASEEIHRTGVLFVAAVAAWATVTSLGVLVAVMQIGMWLGAMNVGYFFLALLGVAVAGFFVAIPICMVVGLPLLTLTRWLKLDRWWQWAALGAAAGVAILFGLAATPWPFDLWPFSAGPFDLNTVATVAGIFSVAGAVAGVVAWREEYRHVSSPPSEIDPG